MSILSTILRIEKSKTDFMLARFSICLPLLRDDPRVLYAKNISVTKSN